MLHEKQIWTQVFSCDQTLCCFFNLDSECGRRSSAFMDQQRHPCQADAQILCHLTSCAQRLRRKIFLQCHRVLNRLLATKPPQSDAFLRLTNTAGYCKAGRQEPALRRSVPMRVGCWWRLGSPDPRAQFSYYATTNTAGDCEVTGFTCLPLSLHRSGCADPPIPMRVSVGGSHKAVCF